MKKISEQQKRKTAEWLDERWMIAHFEAASPADMCYYNGAVKAIEQLGFDWERDGEGKHTIY